MARGRYTIGTPRDLDRKTLASADHSQQYVVRLASAKASWSCRSMIVDCGRSGLWSLQHWSAGRRSATRFHQLPGFRLQNLDVQLCGAAGAFYCTQAVSPPTNACAHPVPRPPTQGFGPADEVQTPQEGQQQSATPNLQQQIALDAQKQQEERWKIQQAQQTNIFEVQQDVTINRSQTQDKLDGYIRN